jgi:hypothetical protein
MENNQQQSTKTGLSAKQLLVIESIAAGASVTEATARAGVDRTTFYLWRRDDEDFEATLNLARHEFGENVRARMRRMAEDAIKTIEGLTASAYSPSVRQRAAQFILSAAVSEQSEPATMNALKKWRADVDPLNVAMKELTKVKAQAGPPHRDQSQS